MRDGNIQLPLLGTKNISGLTLETAKKKLTGFYKEELIRPEIDMSLIRARPIRISLIGEVQRPGSYTLDTGESSRVDGSKASGTRISGYQTVVDAIQKAGGLTFDADISNVNLFRKLPDNTNEVKKADLDLLEMIRNGNQVHNPILFDGDIIRINRNNKANYANTIETNPNNLIREKIKLHVIGEVDSPGMYEVKSNTRISQAILIAGGPKTWRYNNKVQLLRVKRNGSVEVKKFLLIRKVCQGRKIIYHLETVI